MSFRAYGQFPLVKLLPFESGARVFCRGEKGGLQAALKHTSSCHRLGVVIFQFNKAGGENGDR